MLAARTTTPATVTTEPAAAPTTAHPVTTTTKDIPGSTSPARAATGLVDAWQTGKRTSAATYADAAAVRAMFLIPTEPVSPAGPCQQDGAEFACAYFTKGGNTFFLRTRGTRTTGYRIATVTTSTD
jgi:hypothetical protein